MRRQRGRGTDVGRALAEISERRLYREQGFATFEAYCAERWGWSRKTGYEYIRAADAAQNVTSTVQTLPSLTQAVALAPLPPDQQREVAANIDFGKATVREVREVVKERRRGSVSPHHSRSKNRKWG